VALRNRTKGKATYVVVQSVLTKNAQPRTPRPIFLFLTMAIIPSSPFKKAKFKHSTPRRRNRIVARYSSGVSAKAVAAHEGVEEVHVRGVVKRFRTQDYGISRPGRGRPPKLTERDKRALLREVAKDPFV
jgi:hypothetical protein